jgi:hypothetical protein
LENDSFQIVKENMKTLSTSIYQCSLTVDAIRPEISLFGFTRHVLNESLIGKPQADKK